MQSGAMKVPHCITFSPRRTLTPALFQGARHRPETKVWDETESRTLPGPATARHHCRQSEAAAASTTLKSRRVGEPKVAFLKLLAWAPLAEYVGDHVGQAYEWPKSWSAELRGYRSVSRQLNSSS
jgi:hypothetical protein